MLLRGDGSSFWLNTQDNNETDPDATDGSAAGWVSLNADWNASSGPGRILNRPNLAKVATSGQYGDLLNKPIIPPAYTLPPATATTLGGVIAGAGLPVAANGTLSTSATGTTIVNLKAAPSVALDLTPITQGAPEILFNLPVAAATNCVLTVSNPLAAGVLAEFVLQVANSAGSAMT